MLLAQLLHVRRVGSSQPASPQARARSASASRCADSALRAQPLELGRALAAASCSRRSTVVVSSATRASRTASCVASRRSAALESSADRADVATLVAQLARCAGSFCANWCSRSRCARSARGSAPRGRPSALRAPRARLSSAGVAARHRPRRRCTSRLLCRVVGSRRRERAARTSSSSATVSSSTGSSSV